jgi:hypothetical protein
MEATVAVHTEYWWVEAATSLAAPIGWAGVKFRSVVLLSANTAAGLLLAYSGWVAKLVAIATLCETRGKIDR